MSVKSKHSSKKSSIGKKEKKKKLEYSDEDIESSEEELDLTKECHPIGYYLNDRAEMIDQMFSVIKGNKLKAMLPPILKDCDIEQLKLQCLDQLLGMSDKRITCILEGESLETSSESEVIESDEYDTDEKNGTSHSNSEESYDSQVESQVNNLERKHRKRRGDFSNELKSRKLQKQESEPVEQGKTLLEILELEMRARAIRALLKQSGNDSKGSDQVIAEPRIYDNEMKEVSGEVVDLTECEDDEFSTNTKKETREEEDVEKKISNFEETIEKSKVEKPNRTEDEKSKRLQAELEIRNKLFKKKIYRTRQQRMENEEEEKVTEKNENKELDINKNEEIKIKQEPVEPVEVILEDPEEGEVSSSEDEHPVEIKQEPIEPMEEPVKHDFETKVDESMERVTAIDNGTFVSGGDSDNNLDNILDCSEVKDAKDLKSVKDVKDERDEKSPQVGVIISGENGGKKVENKSQAHLIEQESEISIRETSWRDRWLQKDGVQKLVKSSKIYAKVKKRIAEKSQKAKEEVLAPSEVNSDSNSNSRMEMIEGSIEEYERLLGKNGNSHQPEISEPGRKVPENREAEKS